MGGGGFAPSFEAVREPRGAEGGEEGRTGRWSGVGKGREGWQIVRRDGRFDCEDRQRMIRDP